jgi:GDP-L-fucose synthase|tara:strand:+ start:12244 stop:13176 length:933 start_codon:yes stop_codon:yes gene_type:complete
MKIFIAGHNGLVGSAIKRRLEKEDVSLLFANRDSLDLLDQKATDLFFEANKPDIVIDAAAKVGGIHANNVYPAEFIQQNLLIQNNIIHNCYKHKVKKLIFLGSICIYPKFAEQPIKEEYLLTSPLEPTNEPYAISKIAGIKMCQSYYRQYGCDFFSLMPTNQYGPHDNFHPENSHVLPALLRRFHEAKTDNLESVEVWGTGKAKREFQYVDDLADACAFAVENITSDDIYPQGATHLNVGTGEEYSIENLAIKIAAVVGYQGDITFQTNKPDGVLRRVGDNSRINNLGWKHKYTLDEGLNLTYNWYINNV